MSTFYYLFDSNKIYTHFVEITNPLLPLPGRGTQIPPPVIPPGMFAEFKGTHWAIVNTYPKPLPSEMLRIKSEKLNGIDNKAGEVRTLFITSVPGQEGTYLIKAAEAKQFQADGFPVENIDQYIWIKGESEARGISPVDVTIQILTEEAQWMYIGSQIEKVRMGSKNAIRNATTIGEVEGAFENAKMQFDTIAQLAEPPPATVEVDIYNGETLNVDSLF